jgi:hypothetical protein
VITFSKFPNHGRLGNQLFQYAAMIGISNKLRTRLILPGWEIAQYLSAPYPTEGDEVGLKNRVPLNEVGFEYDQNFIRRAEQLVKQGSTPDMHGYFQSEQYWAHCRPLVRNSLAFKPEFLDQVRRKYWRSFANKKKVIAIHIRRGDYVGNTNYVNLPPHYFITALIDNFPDWEKYNIIVFGDDIAYCKVHFDCLPNVAFSEGQSPVEDLALGSMCHHFIIPNSSFAWWMAYLGQKKDTITVRPTEHFTGKLAKNNIKDYYPADWRVHWAHKIDLRDVTFTIPVAYDHKDRKKNLDLCVCMLQHYFDTNIMISEQGGNSFAYMTQYVQHYHQHSGRAFHRTRMLNDMALKAGTRIVANWDADVVVSPLQILRAVQFIREGADMVYPYGGQFARVPRLPWFGELERTIDIGVVGSTKFNGMNNNDAESFGGAVLFHRDEFISGGMENENFVSFGPEDMERLERFKKLGKTIRRVPGPLYHINHWVGVNSSNRHQHVKQNRAEWEKILNMSSVELSQYVHTWQWNKRQK